MKTTVKTMLDRYSDIKVSHKNLTQIINNFQDVDLSLSINGEIINLNHLEEENKKVILGVSNAFNILLNKATLLEEEMKDIISQLELKDSVVNIEDSSKEEEMKEERIEEEGVSDNPSENPFDFKSQMSKLIEELDSGEIIIPVDVLHYFKSVMEIEVDLSDVNKILAEKVESGVLKTVYYVRCYKCDSGYETYLEKLPKNIICPNCSEDILNIEIQYKKA